MASKSSGNRGSGHRKGPWSQAEVDKLKRKYGKTSDGALARELNRSVESLRRMARKVFNGDAKAGPWTPSEVKALKEYWGVADMDKMELVLRRTPTDIERKARELRGQLQAGRWSAEDIQRLKRHYGTRKDEDLVVILGRPVEEIIAKASEYRLAKDKSSWRRIGDGKRVRMPRWTPEEVSRLRELYPDTANLEIARELGRTLKSVVSKAHDLGLKKSADRLRDMGRENVEKRYNGDDARDAGPPPAADESDVAEARHPRSVQAHDRREAGAEDSGLAAAPPEE